MKPSLVLFDGVCKLCNASVRFILKRDPKARFYFAPLQSQLGRAVLKRLGKRGDEIDTLLLVKGQKVYTRSSALLHIARGLKGAWPLLYVFIAIPKVLRDGVYRWISKNRYKWFGKRTQCTLPTTGCRPTAGVKSRFLSQPSDFELW